MTQKAADIPETIVSESGASIPVEVLRAAGIRPGDRVAFVRTTRGSLVVVPAVSSPDGPSLRTVVGIGPRPDTMTPETDLAFLQEIRFGDED
jgi:bifunctional DNA-binding transcriptional regulator/antitoxin component of YhaV-PrlF toxin-antitoxin module